MNFAEAFMGRKLEGKVVRSVLNGDLTCEYEIEIPNDIMRKFVTLERKGAGNMAYNSRCNAGECY